MELGYILTMQLKNAPKRINDFFKRTSVILLSRLLDCLLSSYVAEQKLLTLLSSPFHMKGGKAFMAALCSDG